MKERPIIFSPEMVKAILDGRKTQTRRVIKPQPLNADYWTEHNNTGHFYPNTNAIPPVLRSTYQVGDHLWVREKWNYIVAQPVCYGAGEDDWDYEGVECEFIPKSQEEARGVICYFADDPGDCKWWRPSIHMPLWASRITLEVTGVRVEKLQQINGYDACAEGIIPSDPGSPIRNFADYWDSLNGKKYPWGSNPWVWVIQFERIK
ncbi:MAG: hypothetical protein JW908_00680 [Anaerolineales bacterium]|nr:hypothetical protein [Anaerolineales bacterium]